MTTKPSKTRSRKRKAPPSPPLTDRELNRVLFPLVHALLEGLKTAKELAGIILRETGIQLARQQVHDVLRIARSKAFFLLTPPANYLLESKLERLADRRGVRVVAFRGEHATNYVAQEAAVEVRDLIFKIAGRREGPVHIGLGIGWTTKLFVDSLLTLLRSGMKVPPLVIHALCQDLYFKQGLETPVAYTTRFLERFADVRYVPFGDGPANGGEARERKHEIEILVTSFASSQDHESYLWESVCRTEGEAKMKELIAYGCLGDLQLHPFSATGPMPSAPNSGSRILFDIPEMIALREQPDRYVVLMAGRQRNSAKGKVDALRPLLMQPKLQVWSHLIVDFETAYELAGRPPEVDIPIDPGL